MKKFTKIIAMVLCIIMTVCAFASCALYDDNGDTNKSSSASSDKTDVKKAFTEKELDTAVITVGKREVKLSEYVAFFEQIANYYSENYGVDITEDSQTLSQYVDLITDSLAKDATILYNADEMKLTDFSDEQKKEIEEKYQKELDDMYDYYTQQVGDETYSDEADKQAAIDNYVLDEAKYYCGNDATLDDYKAYLRKQVEEQYITDLLKAEVVKDIKVEDDEIQTWYDDSLSDDKTYYTEHPEAYFEAKETFEMTGMQPDGKTTVPPLYAPSGYYRVMDILITDKDAKTSDEYADNKKRMEEIETQFGKLAFDEAVNGADHTAGKEELVSEYAELQEKNDAELAKIYADAKKKADKAYKKLEDGEKFATVMEKYTESDDFKKDGIHAKGGKLISIDYDTTWSEKVVKEFSKLSKGKYSPVFFDEDGCHIIYYVSTERSGNAAIDTVRENIIENLLSGKQDEAYEKAVEEWVENAPVKYNWDLIERVGK